MASKDGRNSFIDCPLEECLELLSGAWTTKILWYLHSGPKRFGALKKSLEGISSKMLATRLRELEEKGLLAREVQPTTPPSAEYSMTDLGKKFQPVLLAVVGVSEELRKTVKKKKQTKRTRRSKRS